MSTDKLPYYIYNDTTECLFGPIFSQEEFGDKPLYDDYGTTPEQREAYDELISDYNARLTKYSSFPVHLDLQKIWQDGGRYYPGKDFKHQHQMTTWKKEVWYDCHEEAYIRTVDDCRRIIAIPIPQPTTDIDTPAEGDYSLPEFPVKLAFLGANDNGGQNIPVGIASRLQRIVNELKSLGIEVLPMNTEKIQANYSIAGLIKQLDEANPWKDYDKHVTPLDHIVQGLKRGYIRSIENLRELLSGKIITDPEAISKLWDAAQDYGCDIAAFGHSIDPDKATYLKEHFNIDL